MLTEKIDIKYLSAALPEDVAKAKWAGDFALAHRRIARLLEGVLSDSMRKRLLLEEDRLTRLEQEYPYSEEQAYREMCSYVPDFKREELDECILDGSAEYIYVMGGRRFHEDFASSLMKMKPALGLRAGRVQSSDDLCGEFISRVKREGTVAMRFAMKLGVQIKPELYNPDTTYRIHIPVVANAAQISDIKVDCAGYVASADAKQRTAYFEQKAPAAEVAFSFTNTIRYFDAWNPPAPQVFYPNEPEPMAEDTAEQLPHILFTPTIRMLAEQLRGSETRPLYIARAFYDYITLNVRYSFMRSYPLIDNISEYCATGLKGDCGVQALLFIALCRVSGIPARWQSGLTCEPGDAGCHDWAQFYTEEYGWLFADPSFGGGGVRRNNEERRRFYFGNLDCYRMPANRAIQSEFDPPKRFMRREPIDNQVGEIETEKGPFAIYGFRRTYEVNVVQE